MGILNDIAEDAAEKVAEKITRETSRERSARETEEYRSSVERESGSMIAEIQRELANSENDPQTAMFLRGRLKYHIGRINSVRRDRETQRKYESEMLRETFANAERLSIWQARAAILGRILWAVVVIGIVLFAVYVAHETHMLGPTGLVPLMGGD